MSDINESYQFDCDLQIQKEPSITFLEHQPQQFDKVRATFGNCDIEEMLLHDK